LIASKNSEHGTFCQGPGNSTAGPAHIELARLCMDALRTADGTLITTEDIALRVIKAKGFDAADAALRKAFGEQTLAILRMFRKQGRVDKIGVGARER
jgi:hypothetical protein